jgi:hypothetical protein
MRLILHRRVRSHVDEIMDYYERADVAAHSFAQPAQVVGHTDWVKNYPCIFISPRGRQ